MQASSSSGHKLRETSMVISKESLQSKIDALNDRKGLDEALKTKLLSLYQASQDNLSTVDNAKARIITFNQAIKQAPSDMIALQKEIDQTQARVSKQKIDDYSQFSTQELEQKIINDKGRISSLDEQLKKTETELALQQSRPVHIREEIVTAKQDIETTQNKIQLPATKNNSKIET